MVVLGDGREIIEVGQGGSQRSDNELGNVWERRGREIAG
jgi:hypothetical protein